MNEFNLPELIQIRQSCLVKTQTESISEFFRKYLSVFDKILAYIYSN